MVKRMRKSKKLTDAEPVAAAPASPAPSDKPKTREQLMADPA
jgi:hypothetical protein